jgi:Tfp pilus assembly protein PilO
MYISALDGRRVNPFVVGIISTALSVLILYVGWSFFVSAQDEPLAEQRKQVHALAAENEINRVVEREEPALRAEVERVKEAYCAAAPLVSNDSDVSQVLADIQREAVRNQVTLTGITTFKDAVNSPQFDKLQQREFPATATGSYSSVRRFFQALARQNRIVVVPSFEMIGISPRVSTGFMLIAYNAPPKVPALPAEYGALRCEATGAVAQLLP